MGEIKARSRRSRADGERHESTRLDLLERCRRSTATRRTEGTKNPGGTSSYGMWGCHSEAFHPQPRPCTTSLRRAWADAVARLLQMTAWQRQGGAAETNARRSQGTLGYPHRRHRTTLQPERFNPRRVFMHVPNMRRRCTIRLGTPLMPSSRTQTREGRQMFCGQHKRRRSKPQSSALD